MRLLAVSSIACLVTVAAVLPRKASDIPIALPDGKKLDISGYRGKVVCLAFILTT